MNLKYQPLDFLSETLCIIPQGKYYIQMIFMQFKKH